MRFFFGLFLCPLLFFSQTSNYNVSNIPPELLSGADAVVRHDEMLIEILSKDKMTILSKRVVTVLNENGDQHTSAYVYYDKGTKVNRLLAIVYDKNGNILKKIKSKDFIDQSAIGGGTLYSDDRVKFLRYTPVTYPYTIEFTREYETEDTAFIPTWSFLDDYDLSVEMSKFTIKMSPNIRYRVKERNFDEFGVVAKKNDGAIVYVAQKIHPLKPEPYAPAFYDISPSVSFALEEFNYKGVYGAAKNWEEFGSWVHNSLLKGQDNLPGETKTKIRSLVDGISDEKEIVKRVYNYVQENTRYISVQLGIGGWQPISAFEVDKVKYGDCKGLTNYTKALLGEVGIDSYYTVIYGSRAKKDIDPDFPCLQGNHVVLNVPTKDEDLWLECTSQEVPVDYSAFFTDDRYALKVTPNGGEIVRTKQYPDEGNGQRTRASVVIDEMGKINAQVVIESTGTQYNQKYFLPSITKKEQEESYQEYWDYVNNLKVVSTDFNNDKKAVRFVENVQVETPDYISTAGNNLLLVPNMFNRYLNVPKRIRNRNFDIVVSRGFLDEDEFKIELPKSIQIESLLNPVSVENEFGSYEVKMEKINEHQITYYRKLLIKQGTFSKEKYKEFRDFRKKIAQTDNAKIVLLKKNQP